MYGITIDNVASGASNSDIKVDNISHLTVPSVSLEDELQGVLSDATAHVIQTVAEVGILPELVLSGLAMNVINMAVFLRQGLSDRINLCLFSLAISDSGYILFLFITRLHSTFRLFDPPLGQYWQIRCLSLVGVYVGFMATSNCLTLLISLERCLLVISPLTARNRLSTRKMAVIVVLTFCACLGSLGTFCVKHDVIGVTDPVTNVTRYQQTYTQFYLNHSDVIDFLFEIASGVIPVTSLIGVVIATSIIAVRMRAVAEWRQKTAHTMTSTERGEASVTRMLFVVCVMYAICSIPSALRPLVTVLVYDFRSGMRYENLLFTSVSLMHLLAVVNSSFNFVIYYVMSTRFRSSFKDVFISAKTRRGAVECVSKT